MAYTPPTYKTQETYVPQLTWPQVEPIVWRSHLRFSILLAFMLVESLLIARFVLLYYGYDPASNFNQNLIASSSVFLEPFSALSRGTLVDVPYIEWSIPLAFGVYGYLTKGLCLAVDTFIKTEESTTE